MSLKLAGSAAAVSAALVFAPPAYAEPLSGTFAGKIDKQTVRLRGGFDHVQVEETALGVNRSPGSPFDGAKVQWSETVTLDKGAGPVQGTITFTTPTGTETSAFRGTAKMDANQLVTATGTFKSVSGKGTLNKGAAHGVFSVKYSSKTDFTGDWKVTGGASKKLARN